MHVEIRKEGKKRKYFLAHSYREGDKVHKFRKYLGQDLKKSLLEERKNIAEKLILEEIHKYNIISDPLQVQLSQKEIEEIKKLQAQIPLKISHLSKEDWETFSKIFTYNTNAIEGSKLNAKEVKDLLEADKWPDKSKEDIAEAYGVDEAIRYIRTNKEHISVELIKRIHKIVFKNSKSFAGQLRKKGEEVVVMGGGIVIHEGAPQARINHLLNKLVEWYELNKNKYPALILSAVIHNQFENIHPFRDGNGRVGRILLNNILIKHGLPPVNIDFKNRVQYYESLQEYEKNHDLKPTIELYLKEYDSLKKQLDDYKQKKM
ncbi:TPA: Fic family protein [Candidatus Woesearchaeota archaeon]|nr:Fic family protein [Candidatus Woesearchaeota archaeon]HIH32242.1 Fic family protein [Candidatus Woesearchaeota archaeon]HIH54743.1 Fic family protein [Candidatus Woesearchaeota archaeon]HIJ01435.1 Fic family protein [Candidatus Woesearchaeota archaeon]HIJ14698.1 Fic family protein [Candidatus Woesearchaeota archaeon]